MKKIKEINPKRATIAISEVHHISAKDIKIKFNIGIKEGILTTSN